MARAITDLYVWFEELTYLINVICTNQTSHSNWFYNWAISALFLFLSILYSLFNTVDGWLRTTDLWCWNGPLYELRHNQYPSAGKFSKSKAVVVAQLADLFRPVSLGSSFLYFNIVETTLCWSIAHWFATSNQSAEFHRKVVMLCWYLLMTSSPIQLR